MPNGLASAGSLGFGYGLQFKVPDYTPEIMAAIREGVGGFAEGISAGIKEARAEKKKEEKFKEEELERIKGNFKSKALNPELQVEQDDYVAKYIIGAKEHLASGKKMRYADTEEAKAIEREILRVQREDVEMTKAKTRIDEQGGTFYPDTPFADLRKRYEEGEISEKELNEEFRKLYPQQISTGTLAKQFPIEYWSKLTAGGATLKTEIYKRKDEKGAFVDDTRTVVDLEKTEENVRIEFVSENVYTAQAIKDQLKIIEQEEAQRKAQQGDKYVPISPIDKAALAKERAIQMTIDKRIAKTRESRTDVYFAPQEKKTKDKGGIQGSGYTTETIEKTGILPADFRDKYYDRYREDYIAQGVAEKDLMSKEAFLKDFTKEYGKEGEIFKKEVMILKTDGRIAPERDFQINEKGTTIKGIPSSFKWKKSDGEWYVKVLIPQTLTAEQKEAGEVPRYTSVNVPLNLPRNKRAMELLYNTTDLSTDVLGGTPTKEEPKKEEKPKVEEKKEEVKPKKPKPY